MEIETHKNIEKSNCINMRYSRKVSTGRSDHIVKIKLYFAEVSVGGE